MVVQANGLKSRWQQGCAPLGVHRGILCLFLAPAALLLILGVPWLTDASPQSLPSSPHGVLRVCLCRMDIIF